MKSASVSALVVGLIPQGAGGGRGSPSGGPTGSGSDSGIRRLPGLLQALPLRPGGKGRRAFAPASSASLGARFLWSRAQSCSPTPVNFLPSVAALWLAFASVRSLIPFIHSARHRWRCCPQDTPPWPRRGRLLRRPSCHPGSSAPPARKDLRPRNCFGESRCPWDAALALPRRINA